MTLRLRPAFAAIAYLVFCGAPACYGTRSKSPPPRPYTGTFHPPPKPGFSIENSKACECRACDPASCCGAERVEDAAEVPAECNREDYEFPEQCGIKVATCTPRCYSHVWRVPVQASCHTARPLVCCD